MLFLVIMCLCVPALASHVAAGAHSIARAADVASIVLPLRLAVVQALPGFGTDAPAPATLVAIAVGSHEAGGESGKDLRILY